MRDCLDSLREISDHHENMLAVSVRSRATFWVVAAIALAVLLFFAWRIAARLGQPSERGPASRLELAQQIVKANGNAAAYALYLRARELENHQNEDDLRRARDLYGDAIASEPGLALAHARYSIVLSSLGEGASAQREAEEALRLDPALGEGHFARATCLERSERYHEAVPEVELALRALPQDSEIIYKAASLHRRLGRWKQSLAEFEKAVATNPQNFDGPTDLAYHLSLMREWPAATAAWDRALAIVPEYMFNRICRAYVDFWARGDLRRGKALLASFPLDYAGQFKDFLTWMRWDLNLIERNYGAAEEAVASMKEDRGLGGFLGPINRSYMRGCTELAQNHPSAAAPLFTESLPFFEQRVQKFPARATGRARLAMAYAFAGRKDDALREAATAAKLCPESKDAFDGACISTGLAVVYAHTGEKEKAIALIERLLHTPGALNYDCSITLNDLKYRWLWDPLRDDPRFQKILAAPEPKTIVP